MLGTSSTRAGLAAAFSVALSAALVTSAAPAALATPPPNVDDTQTIPVYSYTGAIRESVWVEAPIDSDLDGVKDRIAVDIVRPREPVLAGHKVPVIMDASPYYQSIGRGNESEVKAYDSTGTITKIPQYYDNYFVPRGYAFAAVDLPGTNRSTGCVDVGGPAEVAGVKAVIDWLNGRAKAYDAGGALVTASWTNGSVGMVGNSWDGSIANGVAATGVAGLKTIVAGSAITSWYHYMRMNGIVIGGPGWMEYLGDWVSGRPAGTCDAMQQSLREDTGEGADDYGDYNAFWAERDYRTKVDNVQASVLVLHGLGDINVQTHQFDQWWRSLGERGVPRKMWLSQVGHESPFDVNRAAWVDTAHRWFDYWLYGINNGIMDEPQVTVETGPGTWTTQASWPYPGSQPVTVNLNPGTLGGSAPAAGTTSTYTDQGLSETDTVTSPTTTRDGRLVYLSAPLTGPLHISGTPTVTLRLSSDKPTAYLSARLVDYGTASRVDVGNSEGIRTGTTESCWGESTAADDACYKDTYEVATTTDLGIVARGFMDAAHGSSLTDPTPLQQGQWYTMTIPLAASEATIPAGHTVGLVLAQSDPDIGLVETYGATVSVDLAASTLSLPTVGGATVPAGVAGASALAPMGGSATGPRTAPAQPAWPALS